MIDPRSITGTSRPGQRDSDQAPVTLHQRFDSRDPQQIAEYEATEAAAGMFRMALLSGNHDEAEAAWRDGLEEIEALRQAGTPWKEVPLASIGLSVRTLNLIEEQYGAILVGDLAGLTWDKFIRWPNAAECTWKEIVNCLQEGKRRHELAREERKDG